MSEKIVIVLHCGLGNQLFQYAAGVAISSELGGELFLTPQENNVHSSKDYRSFMKLGKVNQESDEKYDIEYNDISEPYLVWNPQQFRGAKRIWVKGLFQYYPTIQNHIPLIRDSIFQALGSQRQAIKQKYRVLLPRQTAFMHVRRGDFTQYSSTVFWLQGAEYYEEALSILKARTGKRRILILSDDPEWCKQQTWCSSGEIVDEPDEVAGLLLMSLCEGGAIIANSTYSWWGAMLGSGFTSSPIVYPRRWFQTYKPNLFPENWIAAGPEPHAG